MLPEPATLIPSAMTMAASLGYGFVSAVVPVVNAELYIVAAASVVPRAQQPVMVTIFTLGTMAGKMALYLLAARLVSSRSAKARAQVEQWVDRLRHRQGYVWPVVFASTLFGFPPLYAVTLAAGVLRISMVGFFVVGCIGRFARFSAITWASDGVGGMWH